MELRLRARYGACADVTTWDLLYNDVYQCQCCGTRMRREHLEIVE